MIPQVLLKLLVPKILDIVIQQFKLDKVLKYVEDPNDADKRIDELETDVFVLKQQIKELSKPKTRRKKT